MFVMAYAMLLTTALLVIRYNVERQAIGGVLKLKILQD
jgi:hypothetical protein